MSEKLAPDVSNYLSKEKAIVETKKPIPEKLPLPTVEDIPKELLGIAENISKISGTWNPVEIYTADSESIEKERAKVFDAYDNGDEYNPTFTYSYANSLDLKPARKQLLEQMQKLRQFGERKKDGKEQKGGKLTLNRIPRLFRTALYFKIKDDLATCNLVEGIKEKNEDKIAKALKQKYPGTDQSLYDLAVAGYIHLTHNGDPDDSEEISQTGLLSPEEFKYLKNKEASAKEQEEAFKWALSQYGILRTAENGRGFLVKATKNATSIDVRDKSADGPTVFLPIDRPKPMTADKLLLLLAHEIEGHARQSVNGEELFYIGGGRLKIDNEQLYEGLGLRYELNARKKLFGQEESTPRPYYVFGIKMAEEGASFFEIFKDQMERHLRVSFKLPSGTQIPPLNTIDPTKLTEIKRKAWMITYRVMRGHTDMSNKKKFAMAKDLGYLRGYQMDKQLRDNGLGFLNEEGIIASGVLPLLAEIHLPQDTMPIPFLDIATKYWEEVLKPQMIKEKGNN